MYGLTIGDTVFGKKENKSNIMVGEYHFCFLIAQIGIVFLNDLFIDVSLRISRVRHSGILKD